MYLLNGEETARIKFRAIQQSDFELWLPFFEDPSSFLHWNSHFESPEMECLKWFANQNQRYTENRGGMNALIEKQNNNLVGFGGLLVQMVDGVREVEIAYSLLPQYRRRGFATEAAQRCRDFAFSNNLQNSLISIISLTNKESANVASKNGMRIDTQTVYKGNEVNIFRITKTYWETIH